LILLLIANSGSQFANATEVAQQIVMLANSDETIVGVTGWLDSAPTINALNILEQKHIPMVSSTASSDELTNGSPYFFRVNPPDSSQGKAGAEYTQDQLHAKKVVLIEDPHDPYSASLAQAFQSNYDTRRGTIIVNKNYQVGSPNNLYGVLDHALHSHPDLIYFAGYPGDLSPMLAMIHSSLTNVKVMGGDALYVPGDYTSSVQTLAAFPYLYITSFAHPDQLKNDPDKLQFLQAYQHDFDPTNKYAQKPVYGYNVPDGQVILTFDAVNALIKGYQNAFPTKGGVYVTPDELRNGLSEINSSHPLQGISGKIAFLPNGDPQQRNIVVLNGQSIDNEQIVKVYPEP
jgi:ABC-type branched-subunit amino acid transport system substrate-binding protein